MEYGDVYVAVINFAANLEDACQWLIQDAAKSDCTWKVLAVHQPAYYTNPNGSSEAFNRYIPAAAEAAGINVVFSGQSAKEGYLNGNYTITFPADSSEDTDSSLSMLENFALVLKAV